MTKRQIFTNWVYAISGIVLFSFLAPALISATDTALVMFGVLLIILYGVWSYYFWIKPLFMKL